MQEPPCTEHDPSVVVEALAVLDACFGNAEAAEAAMETIRAWRERDDPA